MLQSDTIFGGLCKIFIAIIRYESLNHIKNTIFNIKFL